MPRRGARQLNALQIWKDVPMDFKPPKKNENLLDRLTALASGKENLLDVLEREHQEVKELLEKILKAEKAPERKALFKKFQPAFLAHAHAEEVMFYPLLKQAKEKQSRTDAIEGYIEHHLAEGLVKALAKSGPITGEDWTARCHVVKDLIEHHIKEEQNTIFKDARKNLGEAKLEALVPLFDLAKKKFLARAKI
jgi:hemerythrin superfamily protein